MKAERWLQVERLYHAALERDAEGRAAFLAEACAGDEGLRREVETLLAYGDRSEAFMESPALEAAAKMLAGEREVAAGQEVKHYRVVSPLGAGGMGEVYLAEDTRLKRRVALKFLPAHFTRDKAHLRRFEQEARAAAALSHPNVCVIHEVVETGEGRHCIVMEYVEGATLRERMAEGRMEVGEALDVAVQVASVLSAAHASGIVHRDIKPENIMLRRDGYLKVLDFGLAKLTERQAAAADPGARETSQVNTSPGLLMGTAHYMSPEQARCVPVDARTDLWSLGVVLYEMLAGRPPFDGPTPMDAVVSVVEREPTPLSAVAPNVPARLEQVVQTALAKDREGRYQTADELLADLKSLRRELEFGTDAGRHRGPTRVSRLAATAGGRQSRTSRFPPLRTARSRVLLPSLAGVLIAAGLTYALLSRQSPAPPQTEVRSLAVLPLENLSGEDSQDYFADGMTEALITDLAKISALRVISRPSVMPYRGARKTLPEVGRELNVDAVLTGSVARSGGRVRIAVRLTHAATERTLWADSYERDLRDVLALQRDVTRDIVGQIRVKLTPQEQVRFGSARPVNPAAYEHYLRGKFYLHRQNREDNEAAIAALEGAVHADPTFATAQAELAQAYVWKLFLFAPGEGQLAEKAFVAAEKALALDPDLAVAYLARGRLLWTPANRFPHEKAIREYRRALELNPNLDEARNQLALVLNHVGAFDEALRELQRAVEINPSNNLAQFRIGETLLFQGRYEQALSVLRGVPGEANPALIGHQIVWALFNLGRKEEASAALEQFLKEYPEDNRGLLTSLQAVLAASAGRKRLAEDKIRSAVERGKGFGHFHHTAYHVACAYALMNEPEQAVRWLEVSAEDGFPCYPLFEADGNLDSIRREERFVTFMAKLRQRWEYYRAEGNF